MTDAVSGAVSGKQLVVGMYAHHQGSGHLNRCRSIARRLANRGARVEIFSSAPNVGSFLSTPTWTEQQIPLDFDDPQSGRDEVRDPRAGDTLHWAPLQHPGYRERMAVLAAWIRSARPDVFYVDVSVEVAVFVRLLGVPVINIAMPGERGDAPHQLAYAQAAGIIAAFPQSVPLPAHLEAHASRVHRVGGISTFEDSVPEVAHTEAERESNRVLVMQGMGGTGWADDYWDHVQQACPDYQFTFLGGEYRSDNPLVEMTEADVVISAAGQNSVADIALSGKPCVLLPQQRAFAEQFATARAAESLGLTLNREEAPAPEKWPALLRKASQMSPEWEKWQVEGAADRAAERILAIAKENRSEGEPA